MLLPMAKGKIVINLSTILGQVRENSVDAGIPKDFPSFQAELMSSAEGSNPKLVVNALIDVRIEQLDKAIKALETQLQSEAVWEKTEIVGPIMRGIGAIKLENTIKKLGGEQKVLRRHIKYLNDLRTGLLQLKKIVQKEDRPIVLQF